MAVDAHAAKGDRVYALSFFVGIKVFMQKAAGAVQQRVQGIICFTIGVCDQHQQFEWHTFPPKRYNNTA